MADEASTQKLLEEIQKLRDYRQIQARYQTPLSDDQLERLAAQDRTNKQRSEQRERDRIEAAARDAEKVKEIRRKAVEFVRDGRLLVNVSGVPVPTVTADLTAACPDCGGPLLIQDPLFIFTRDMMECCDNPQILYSGQSPILRQVAGHYMAVPAYLDVIPCGNCKKTSTVIIQAVIC
jgi:hypothetical protein